jgi:hypothetical protein
VLRRTPMKIIQLVLLHITLATATQHCSANTLTIALRNAPKGADGIEIAASGPGLATPVLARATPGSSGDAELVLNLPDSPHLFVRAIALGSSRTGRAFPFILAAATEDVETNGPQTIMLDFSARPVTMTIGPIQDSGDGTVVVPVAFSGGGEFFEVGQVVNLWAGAVRTDRLAMGDLFLAPLIRGTTSTILNAFFKVPTSLANSYLQPGYHALNFRLGGEIPLLIGGSQQVGLSGGLTSTPGADTSPGTARQQAAPGTYIVVIGADGRLVRIRQ